MVMKVVIPSRIFFSRSLIQMKLSTKVLVVVVRFCFR